MKTLVLDPATRRYLTAESLDNNKNPTAVTCDLKGKTLGPSSLPLPVYTEVGTGKAYVRVIAVLPSDQDAQSIAARDAIVALDPIFVDGNDGTMRGWYILAPDFSLKPATEAA
jgi:hypothetical protein